MNHLPLFYYPTTWLCVDDDDTILDSISETLAPYNKLKLLKSPTACLDFLKTYQSPLAQQSFLYSKTEDDSYGVLHHSPVDFDVTCIAKLADLANRHDEITTMVVDFNMPKMNGLKLAEACQHLSLPTILLTGENQPDLAIAGFNDSLIHRFIQKSEAELSEKLICYLQKLTWQYFQTQSLALLQHLEADSPLPLSDPIFIEFFENYRKKNKITEFYLIDKQGSFLCIDHQGKHSCLVVHTDYSLDEWLALQDNQKDISEADLQAITKRKKIPFAGIGKETWELESAALKNCFYPAEVLEGRERYFLATVKI